MTFFSRLLAAALPSAAVALVLLMSAGAAAGDVTADRVFGQGGSFVTSGCGLTAAALCSPQGVAVDSLGNVFVADTANNRVLEYDTPLSTDTVADRVFGQGGSFTSSVCNLGGISATSLCAPMDVAVDGADNVYIVDWQNNRVLEYFTPLTTDLIADRVFGQNNSFTTGTFTGFWYEVSPSADTLTNPVSVAADSAGNVYIGDRGMHRVLEYNPGDTTADRVFGQFGSFTSGLPDNGGISADSLGDILGIGVDGLGSLYVTDQVAARVLKYNTPVSSDTTADMVFGQLGSFTTSTPNIGGVNADSLEVPTDVTTDVVGNVYISDTGTERTLEYDDPVIHGTTADVVFGQGGNLNSWGNNNGGISADSQADPWSLAFDHSCNLYIVEYGNNRVTEYDKPAHACTEFAGPTPSPSPLPTPPVLNTASGTTVVVSLNGGTAVTGGVTITFPNVSAAGDTSLVKSKTGPPPPSGLKVIGIRGHGALEMFPVDPVYYNLSTNATFSGPAEVCISYDPSQVPDPGLLQLMHSIPGSWTNISSSLQPNHVICGGTLSFSPFALMQPVPGQPPLAVGGTVSLLPAAGDGSDGGALWLFWVIALLPALAAGAAIVRSRVAR